MTTGFKKFGAILGDHVEVGCNSVLNPGTIIGRNSNVYPLSSVRGCVPADSIYKNQENIVIKEVRETVNEAVTGNAGKTKSYGHISCLLCLVFFCALSMD